ncbi:MAG: hypothetical protein WD312_01815 [Candidatus Paceibacterota bacterium]
MKIYIVSSEKHAGKIQEDVYMRDVYRNNGFSCEIRILKDIVKISKPFDVVILKSIWGYHLHHRDFLKQILILKKKNIKLINDYDFIFWNIDKYKYLEELKDVNVIPTTLLNFKNTKKKSEIIDIILQTNTTLNTDVLVIKPCISESGYLTLKYDKAKDNKIIISSLQKNKQLNFIAQPYRSSVLSGEISVVVINGVPLYGIKRFPGIFCEKLNPVYIKFDSLPITIKKEVNVLGSFFLAKFGSYPNICRIDFLKFNTTYEVLEVELIDPDLFFRYTPDSLREKATLMINK